MSKAARVVCLAFGVVVFATLCGCGSRGNTASNTSLPPASGGSSPVTVAILSPQANSTVTGSFRVYATASASTTLKLLLDGAEIWAGQGVVLDTTITALDGTHHLSVQATDSAGTVTEAALDFTASSVPPVVPPAYSVVLDHLEEQSGWLTCGNCGNSGATGATATYLMEGGISLPSTDGNAARYSIGGPYAYTNGYWYLRHTAPTTRITTLRYEFDLYIPAESATAPQAIEFECQQTVGGYVYNFAWQADYARKLWRTFDYVNTRWDDTTVAMTQLTGGQWHHIVAEYHTEEGVVLHDAITIDGTRYVVNVSHAAKYVGGTSKYFTNAFQLDLNKYAVPYAVYVDGMKVSYN